jgi:hypothetical protein
MKHALRSMKRLAVATSLAVAFATVSAEAGASGLLTDPAALPADARAALAKDIARAKAETPELFRAVATAVSEANAIDARARKRGMPMTLRFKALGPRALLPMLDALAFDAHPPRDLTPTAASALRLGLLEAVGIVRDERAVPVLLHALVTSRDVALTRAAAEALARVGTDEAFAAALREARKAPPGSERDRAILAGLHDCRRQAAAQYLAGRLAARPDPETARVVARSLGGVANAWAWRAIAARGEQAAVTRVATRALVEAYADHGGDVRAAIVKALVVVESPDLATEIARARRSASPEGAAALDELDGALAAARPRR